MRRIREWFGQDPTRGIVVALFAMVLIAYCSKPGAEPLFVAKFGEHSITLTDEPCALKAVTNMPTRATWREPNGNVVESCYGAMPEIGLVVLYCADLTVQLVPMRVFERLRAM